MSEDSLLKAYAETVSRAYSDLEKGIRLPFLLASAAQSAVPPASA